MTALARNNAMLESLAIEFVTDALGAGHVSVAHRLQVLWGGQGSLLRLATDVPGNETLIVKCIAPDNKAAHPRGWNTQHSFLRKARSYDIECHWYEHYARRCSLQCKVPRLLGIHQEAHYSLLVLEDLAVEYPRLPERLSVNEVLPCLHWLAEFHALFMQEPAQGLWDRACYWHLDTRPDEWQAMDDGPLKESAGWLDERLKQAEFQTVLHGDAKLANFCFSQDMAQASAVDFQYVGRGCGMSDVAYFLGSCLSEADCREFESDCLMNYFRQLHAALQRRAEIGRDTDPGKGGAFFYTPLVAQSLEQEWRSLYPVAWADFHRFLLGWMPEHTKVNRYGDEMVRRALQARS